MATQLTVDEAVERARRAQEHRISSIRDLAQSRQNVTDVREQTARELAELQASIAQRVGDAERTDVRVYDAAVTAGWSPAELRKIGFNEPDKKARVRRSRKNLELRAAAVTPAAHPSGTVPLPSE